MLVFVFFLAAVLKMCFVGWLTDDITGVFWENRNKLFKLTYLKYIDVQDQNNNNNNNNK